MRRAAAPLLLLARAQQATSASASAASTSAPSAGGLLLRRFAASDAPRPSPDGSVPPEHADAAAAAAEARSVPGWLKGPMGRRLERVFDEEWEEVADPKSGQQCWRSRHTGGKRVRPSCMHACNGVGWRRMGRAMWGGAWGGR
jgi:hypothetical protein